MIWRYYIWIVEQKRSGAVAFAEWDDEFGDFPTLEQAYCEILRLKTMPQYKGKILAVADKAGEVRHPAMEPVTDHFSHPGWVERKRYQN